MTELHPVEKDVKEKVKKLLTKHGWMHFMPASNTYGINGISDTLALKNGIFMAIEIKLKKKTGSPLQEQFMQKVRDHGGYAMLVNMENLPTFEALLIQLGEMPAREAANLT